MPRSQNMPTIRPVCRPALPASTRRRIIRGRSAVVVDSSGLESAAGVMLAICVVLAGLGVISILVYVVFHLFHPFGMFSAMGEYLLGILAGVVGSATVAGVLWLTSLALPAVDRLTARRHQGEFIDPSELDSKCQTLLRRAQQAMDTVVHSEVFAAGLVDRERIEISFSEYEWDLACSLRKISDLRRHLPRRTVGPESAEYTARQKKNLDETERVAVSVVEALELGAANVTEADQELRAKRREQESMLEDQRQANQLSVLDDLHRDARASVERLHLALDEITNLTEETQNLAQGLRGSDQNEGEEQAPTVDPSQRGHTEF